MRRRNQGIAFGCTFIRGRIGHSEKRSVADPPTRRRRHSGQRIDQDPSRSTITPGKIAKAVVTGKTKKTSGLVIDFGYDPT
jgi:hypothetical protein